MLLIQWLQSNPQRQQNYNREDNQQAMHCTVTVLVCTAALQLFCTEPKSKWFLQKRPGYQAAKLRGMEKGPNSGPIEAQFELNSGPIVAQFKPNSGPNHARFRSNSGPIQVQFRSNSGPIQAKFSSNSGPIQVKFRSNLGPIQGQFRFNSGPIQVQL